MLKVEQEDPKDKKKRAKSEVKIVEASYIGAVTKQIRDPEERQGKYLWSQGYHIADLSEYL